MSCSVCLIVKNEGPYLKEWVAHYVALGFDKIIVYDNVSDDGSDIILRQMAANNLIEYRLWTIGSTESPQISAYRDCLKRVKTEWILFVDADELLVLHEYATVGEFLNRFASRPEVTSIGVNWRLFGDSGMAESDGRLLRERFTKAEANGNRHLKSFSRVQAMEGIVNMHVCQTTGQHVHPSGKPLSMTDWGLSDEIEMDVAQLNHYYTKTLAEFQAKIRRGYADVTDNDAAKYTVYNQEKFNAHNCNDVEDTSIRHHDAQFGAAYDKVELASRNVVSKVAKKFFEFKNLLKS